MKRASTCALGLIITLAVPAFARAHCGGNDAGVTAHDPFGSCETDAGDVRCAADAIDATVVKVSTPGSGYGVQVCNEGSDVPVWGRAGVWTDGSKLVVGIDGDKDTAPTNGWTRADAGTDGCIRVRRGDSNGSYFTAGGGTSSTNGGVDQRVCA